MTQLTIAAAAPLVGKDRKTLYRMIKEGKLSVTVSPEGQKMVETSELLRVFGELKEPEPTSPRQRDSREKVAMSQLETANATARIALLEAELRHARELNSVKDEVIQDLRTTLRLLEPPRQAPAPEPAPKGFWTKPRTLFGGR